MKYSFVFILFLALTGVLQAQESELAPRILHIDLAVGANTELYASALSLQQTHGLLKNKALRLGYGLRLHGIGGSSIDYLTAPAKLTQEQANMDTLRVGNPLSFGINAAVHIEYIFLRRFKAGFNIDLAGFGFGRSSNSEYRPQVDASAYPSSLSAYPSPYSLLLVGDRDYGQLRSEFFLAYSPSEKTWIRFGLDMTFSEYNTGQDIELRNNNNRYRHKAMLLFLGFSYKLF